MEALIWIVTGLVAGWLAGVLMKGRDYGLTGNLLLGVIGSIIGGWLLRLAGFSAANDWLKHGLVSLFGAMLLLGIARRLRPMARQTRSVLGRGAGSVTDVTAQLHRLSEFERRVRERLQGLEPHVKDPNAVFDEQMTLGQRLADRVATFGGSWTFIGWFVLFMLVWMVWNTESTKHFDPFPFILLNLMLSCLAALQAPIIMMSQNRLAAKDRIDAKNDFEVNLRAESEISRLHAKFDELREREWAELVDMQRRQLVLLEESLRRLGGGADAPSA